MLLTKKGRFCTETGGVSAGSSVSYGASFFWRFLNFYFFLSYPSSYINSRGVFRIFQVAIYFSVILLVSYRNHCWKDLELEIMIFSRFSDIARFHI